MRVRAMKNFSADCRIFDVWGVHVCRNCGFTNNADHASRQANALVMIHAGKMNIMPPGEKPFELTSGDVLYIPMGSCTATRYDEDGTVATTLSFRMEDDSGPFIFEENGRILMAGASKRLEHLFLSFFDGDRTPNNPFIRLSRLTALLAALDEENPAFAGDGKYELLKPGLRLLEQNFTGNIPMSEIAAASMVSEGYFRRLFHKYCGCSPIAYRNELRMKYIRELIQSGQYSVKEAVSEAGMDNLSLYYRLKRRKTGESSQENGKG